VITRISVALAIIALCFVARVRSRRRAAKIGTIEINPRASTLIIEVGDVNNDSSSDTPRAGANTIARRQLEKQLRAVQKKMVDLEDIERRSSSGSSDGCKGADQSAGGG
jgi:C4-dicarboxylate-specific signal transduction histidine kinase